MGFLPNATPTDKSDFYQNGKYEIINSLGATLSLSEFEETRVNLHNSSHTESKLPAKTLDHYK